MGLGNLLRVSVFVGGVLESDFQNASAKDSLQNIYQCPIISNRPSNILMQTILSFLIISKTTQTFFFCLLILVVQIMLNN